MKECKGGIMLVINACFDISSVQDVTEDGSVYKSDVLELSKLLSPFSRATFSIKTEDSTFQAFDEAAQRRHDALWGAAYSSAVKNKLFPKDIGDEIAKGAFFYAVRSTFISKAGIKVREMVVHQASSNVTANSPSSCIDGYVSLSESYNADDFKELPGVTTSVRIASEAMSMTAFGLVSDILAGSVNMRISGSSMLWDVLDLEKSRDVVCSGDVLMRNNYINHMAQDAKLFLQPRGIKLITSPGPVYYTTTSTGPSHALSVQYVQHDKVAARDAQRLMA